MTVRARPPRSRSLVLAGLGGFVLGAATVLLVVWLYQGGDRPERATIPAPAPQLPQATEPVPPTSPASPPPPDLSRRHLLLPVAGIQPQELQDTFDDARGGSRVHEAIDIIAPRNTPILAVEAGRVAKLFASDLGGLTIYQFDPTETYSYYYAHLERYAEGLDEGDQVRRGQVIGYVGSSGNAGPDNPHLHFAIFRLGADKRWWQGTPINPFPLLGGRSARGAEAPAGR